MQKRSRSRNGNLDPPARGLVKRTVVPLTGLKTWHLNQRRALTRTFRRSAEPRPEAGLSHPTRGSVSRDAVAEGFDGGTRMSGARSHPVRGHLGLRRVAIVSLGFLVGAAASCWLPMAGGDDRGADPQAAAELVVRKRILANWRARQDCIKSFYVAWKPGPNDRMPKWARAGLAGCASAVGGQRRPLQGGVSEIHIWLAF